MGYKDRDFPSLPMVSLEDLVPADHCYRHLEKLLDLSFVRDLVRDRYAPIGRPSVDPVVFFRLTSSCSSRAAPEHRTSHTKDGHTLALSRPCMMNRHARMRVDESRD